jgi:membrane-bound lytic murein transglycosylase D
MKNINFVVSAIALFFLLSIPSAKSKDFSVKSKPTTEDTTFVVPEVDLSILNTPPRFGTEVYKHRLDSITKSIPLDYNSFVQGYIDLYAFRKREQVERMLGLSEYYFPMVERVFKEYKIPAEFKYLAIVESALNPYAVSPVGATGMWQFMFTTAKMYNLEINSHIDERRDPYLATHAAAKYFVDMYRRYGDWLLVIAAYNCGPGNVNRAIRKAGGGTKTFWEIRQYLPQETRGYVPAYIAANYIMTFAEAHNLYPTYPSFSFMTDTLHFTKPVYFRDIEKLCGVNADELRILNPQFKKDFVPAYSQSFALKLPATRRDLVHNFKDSLYSLFPTEAQDQIFVLNTDPMAKNRTVYKTHVVTRGQTLSKLAVKYDVSVAEIKKWNNLKKNALYRGQRLKIKKEIKAPIAQPSTSIAKNSKSKNTEKESADAENTKVTYEYVTKNVSKKHKVKKGENLSLIAAKYDVSVGDIKKWNKLKKNSLQAGQYLSIKTTETLKIAKKVSAKPEKKEVSEELIAENNTTKEENKSTIIESSENATSTESSVVKPSPVMEMVKVEKTIKYKVRKGDYLSTIAQKNKVTVQEIRDWNKMKNSVIKPGQELTIKKYEQKLVAKEVKTSDTEKAIAKVPERNSDTKYVFHKVEKGDTLYSIAKKYAGMTVELLKELNGMKNSDELKAGMVLKIAKKG